MKKEHTSEKTNPSTETGKPVLMEGLLTIIDSDGNVQDDTPGLCGCGQSADMPYCDGGHRDREADA